MQEVLTQSALSQIKAGAPYNGIALIKDYNVALTKNGKEYIQGKIQSGVAVPFKAWGNSKAFSELKTKDYTNVPVYIISMACCGELKFKTLNNLCITEKSFLH